MDGNLSDLLRLLNKRKKTSFVAFGLLGYSFYIPLGYYSNLSLIMCFFAPCCLLAHAITFIFNVKTGYFGNSKPSTDFARRIPLL